MSSFNARITQLQELVIARNSWEFHHFISISIYRSVFFGYKFALYPASGVADLTAVDAAVSAMELQVKAIKDRLREEAQAITKTKARSSHALSLFVVLNDLFPEFSGQDSGSFEALRLDEEPAAVPKPLCICKGKAAYNIPPPYLRIAKSLRAMGYLSVYAKRKRLSVALIMQEIRDIASMEGIKGKHSFLEADIKGPSLKLDNTGKAILISRAVISKDGVELYRVMSAV
ncbi:Spindle and kinetochore-associated protein 1 [Glycine soja]